MDPTMNRGTQPTPSFLDWLMRYVTMNAADPSRVEARDQLQRLQEVQMSPGSMQPMEDAMMRILERARSGTASANRASFLDYLRNNGASNVSGAPSVFEFIANSLRRRFMEQPGTGTGASRVM